MNEPTEAQRGTRELECPFGIRMRHCKFQETRAKSYDKAINGELIFICKLDSLINCPKFEEALDG